MKTYTKKVGGAGKVAGASIENKDIDSIVDPISNTEKEPTKQTEKKNYTIMFVIFGSIISLVLAKFIIKR